MMNKSLIPWATALALSVSVSLVHAAELQWLEGGNAVHASQDKQQQAKSVGSPDAVLEVTLGTGVVATLTGGVYVTADDAGVVLAWATTNSYVALADEFTPNVLHIQTTPAQSIGVANEVAKLSGVTTAMPKYETPVIPK